MIKLRRTQITTYELDADIDVTEKGSNEIHDEMLLLTQLHGWKTIVTSSTDVVIETDDDELTGPFIHKSPEWNT